MTRYRSRHVLFPAAQSAEILLSGHVLAYSEAESPTFSRRRQRWRTQNSPHFQNAGLRSARPSLRENCAITPYRVCCVGAYIDVRRQTLQRAHTNQEQSRGLQSRDNICGHTGLGHRRDWLLEAGVCMFIGSRKWRAMWLRLRKATTLHFTRRGTLQTVR